MTEPTAVESVDEVSSGPVRLVVPAEAAYSRVVRLAASGLASLTGFDVDRIDDVKIAVSEVMLTLVEHGDGASIEFDFAVLDDSFTVRGRTAVTAFDVDDPDLELSRTVLEQVCSDHGRHFADGCAELWAIVTRTG
jgi:serine/threonine-protein kinase RsbW